MLSKHLGQNLHLARESFQPLYNMIIQGHAEYFGLLFGRRVSRNLPPQFVSQALKRYKLHQNDLRIRVKPRDRFIREE